MPGYDPDSPPSAEKFISVDDGVPGIFMSVHYKPASPSKRQFASGFFLSPPFSLDAELRTLFKYSGVPGFDQYILFASANHAFEEEDMNQIMFMADVVAFPTQHVYIPCRMFKLLAKSCTPRYEGIYTKMDSPQLAAAPGVGFGPLPKHEPSGVERRADFVIGILPCHPNWFRQATATAVLKTAPYFFVPSAAPAEAGGAAVMVTSGYPCAPQRYHLEEAYGIDMHDMQDAMSQYKSLALFNTLSASVGDVIAVGKTQIKHRCSAGLGMAGGPVWPLNAPCTFKAIHCKSSGKDLRANFNCAYSAHADLFVLNYARFVVPVLCKASPADWPQPYMQQELTDYLCTHKQLLQQHRAEGRTLWSNAEVFMGAHGTKC
ncbi:hypothetical protein V8C86DRAFT_2842999 [Haematococcus lacustris]